MGRLLNVVQVKEVLNVTQSKAYTVIRELNKELQQQGYLTLQGRVPEQYLFERYNIEEIKELEEIDRK